MPCHVDELTFKIQDVQPISVNLIPDSLICPNSDINIKALVTGGAAPYSYMWNNGDTSQLHTVHPLAPTNFSVVATDICGNTATSTIITGVSPYDLNVISSPDVTVDCPYTPINLFAEANGGTGDYSFNWINSSGNVGSGASIQTAPSTTDNYLVAISDACQVNYVDTVYVTVNISLMNINPTPTDTICPADSTLIGVDVSGGKPPYVFDWDHSDENQPYLTEKPGYSRTYHVNVHDECNTYSIDAYPSVFVMQPKANFEVLSNERMVGLPISFQNLSDRTTSWEWDFGNDQTSTINSPETEYKSSGWYNVTLFSTDDMGCMDSVSKPIFIDPEFYFYAPNSFTPDGNDLNSTYSVSVIGADEITFQIFDRWGNIIYYTSDPYFQWDGSMNGDQAPVGIYIFKCIVTDEMGRKHEFSGQINLLR